MSLKKIYIYYFAALIGLFVPIRMLHAEETGAILMGIKPHTTFESVQVCMVVKVDDPSASDCNEPKCFSGGEAVDSALSAKGLRRICKLTNKSVNRGFDVTYNINGEERVVWTATNPETELGKIGLTVFQEYSPLNTACPQVTFKPEGGASNNETECAPMEDVIDDPAKENSPDSQNNPVNPGK